MAEVELLSQEKFLHYWPNIEEELDCISDRWANHWTKGTIRDLTMSGRFQCWAAGDAQKVRMILFTQIGVYPSGNVLETVLAFGNEVEELIPQVEATLERFAMAWDCGLMQVTGRIGWERKLQKMGWNKSAVVMTKRVSRSMN